MRVLLRIQKIQAQLLSVALLCATFVVTGCGAQNKQEQMNSTVCGTGKVQNELNGLFWLLGDPQKANVVCTAQEGTYRSLQVLSPESRDPILLQDRSTRQTLLVERFSGSAARPSRATWFDATGAVLKQRGDWPQNVYSVIRISPSQALVTGFDFGDLRRFLWAESERDALGKSEPLQFGRSRINPILTLRRGSWVATIDAGFDFQNFKPRTAQASVFREDLPQTVVDKKLIDEQNLVECKNAFQFLILNGSSAVLSCNPQYFGPTPSEKLGVYVVELSEQGEVTTRRLLERESNQVQKIELWGLNRSTNQVFLSLKTTSADDYKGRVVQSGWLAVSDATFVAENRFAGPLKALSSSEMVCACEDTFEKCRAGDFVLVDTATNSTTTISPSFSLPFLSFSADIPEQ